MLLLTTLCWKTWLLISVAAAFFSVLLLPPLCEGARFFRLCLSRCFFLAAACAVPLPVGSVLGLLAVPGRAPTRACTLRVAASASVLPSPATPPTLAANLSDVALRRAVPHAGVSWRAGVGRHACSARWRSAVAGEGNFVGDATCVAADAAAAAASTEADARSSGFFMNDKAPLLSSAS
eukprot:4510903-Pleurochrysis_carterae.AAC.2